MSSIRESKFQYPCYTQNITTFTLVVLSLRNFAQMCQITVPTKRIFQNFLFWRIKNSTKDNALYTERFSYFQLIRVKILGHIQITISLFPHHRLLRYFNGTFLCLSLMDYPISKLIDSKLDKLHVFKIVPLLMAHGVVRNYNKRHTW